MKPHKNIGLFGNAVKRKKFDRNERKFQKHHGKVWNMFVWNFVTIGLTTHELLDVSTVKAKKPCTCKFLASVQGT